VPLPPYRRVKAESQQVELVQDSLEKTLREYTRRPENDTQAVENITLTSGRVNLLVHKLGRAPRGWSIERMSNVFAEVSEKTATTDDKYLALITTDTVTVSMVIW
jgi:hypothetical protein